MCGEVWGYALAGSWSPVAEPLHPRLCNGCHSLSSLASRPPLLPMPPSLLVLQHLKTICSLSYLVSLASPAPLPPMQMLQHLEAAGLGLSNIEELWIAHQRAKEHESKAQFGQGEREGRLRGWGA